MGPERYRYLRAKRAIDLVLSLAAMPVVLPAIVVSAIAIRLDTPGPVFFVQDRVGQHGRRFRLIKLRTMVSNAEELKAQTLDERTVLFKSLADPRITRVGRVLRKTSLDELPQLFNVIRGDMSLVGPRPTSIGLATYESWHTERLEVPPGISGIWQVRGRNETTFDERVRLDIEYIDNLSLGQDLRLIIRTLGVVLKGTGA
jgi:lipopolysaccharide/colanic/teichoic acid biosynthesis glycosyltransferase